jgi:hypothetical protein
VLALNYFDNPTTNLHMRSCLPPLIKVREDPFHILSHLFLSLLAHYLSKD